MSMLLAAFSGDFCDVSFFSRLEAVGLARLECACRGTRQLIQEGGAWGACLAHALPDVAIQGEVRAAADRGAPEERRQEVKGLLSTLASVHTLVPGHEPLAIATLETVKELRAAVRRGLDAAGAHAEAGGGPSRVVVGQFYFPNAMAWAMAIPAAVVATVGEDLDEDPGSLWSVSAPLPFSLPRSSSKSSRRGSEGRRQGHGGTEEELFLRLAWQGDSVLARVTKRGASVVSPVPFPADFGRELVLDVRALGSAPILRSRGTPVRVGGPWKKVNGVCAAGLPRAELAEALAAGLACVVWVRDTLPADGRSAGRDSTRRVSSQCANALNLERSARPRPSDTISLLSFLPEFEMAAMRPRGAAVATEVVTDHHHDGSAFIEVGGPNVQQQVQDPM